jgi:hypothetical protein
MMQSDDSMHAHGPCPRCAADAAMFMRHLSSLSARSDWFRCSGCGHIWLVRKPARYPRRDWVPIVVGGTEIVVATMVAWALYKIMRS